MYNLVWVYVGIAAFLHLACMADTAKAAPHAAHADFVTEWFPENASSAIHLDLARTKILATHAHGGLARFKLTSSMLSLIRTRAGIDPTLIDQLTAANITFESKGTVLFFTTTERVAFDLLSSEGFAKEAPAIHKFKDKMVYHYKGDRPLGLYTPDGHNFIFGDWLSFKTSLLGKRSDKNDLADAVFSHASPIVLCSNPRRVGKRWSKDDLFGTVTAIDFDEAVLVLQMQEVHPTPADAEVRRKSMEADMPEAFEASYGFTTKDGVRYIAKADGRNAIFGMQGPVEKVKKLLDHLLAGTRTEDLRSFARDTATEAIKQVTAAKAAGAGFPGDHTPAEILEALVAGIGTPAGKTFRLPFLTVVERSMVSEFLVWNGGGLALAPESEQPKVAESPKFDMKLLHRSARQISTLTMSAASAGCVELEKTDSPEKIIELLCGKGLSGSGIYEDEHFKGPEISEAERAAIAELLVKSEGYLVYRPNGK